MSDSLVTRLETMEVNESVDYVGTKTVQLNELLVSLKSRQFVVSIVGKRHKVTRTK